MKRMLNCVTENWNIPKIHCISLYNDMYPLVNKQFAIGNGHRNR